jgi:DNA (cytosine-5)-methyltransferase 1
MKLKVLDLFSGIGGFSLGLEKTGHFETIAFCEKDPFCRKVLKKHWPHVRQHNDITRAKFETHVDLVTAGFPCQDISLAGEGAGLSGERSGLFWYIIRTLCMVGRPAVLLENVAALLDRGLSNVLGAMATFGYDAEWHCIPASAVGAPHRRDRIWIYAHPTTLKNKRPAGQQIQPEFVRDLIGARVSRHFAKHPPKNTRWGVPWCDSKPRLCRVDHGLRHRLHALGNAVVPQIPEIIGYEIANDLRDGRG